MFRLKTILTAIGLFLCQLSSAQDSSAFFSFDRLDLDAINAQNLNDVLKTIPMLNTVFVDGWDANSGGIAIQSISLYRDGFPLAMDQNISFDYTTIGLWDIERIEVSITKINTIEKNNNGVIIELYSQEQGTEPLRVSAVSSMTSLVDNYTNASVSVSNARHNLMIGGNRAFTSALENESSREDIMGAKLRQELNLRYSYNILSTVKLNIHSTNAWQTNENRGEQIEGTTRVIDQSTNFRMNTLYGSVVSALSKNHNFELKGKFNHYSNSRATIDRDLHSQREEVRSGFAPLDTLAYNQVFMQLALKGQLSNYGYNVGIDISNLRDRRYPSINAIQTSYSDYSVFGLFNYQYKKSFQVEAGAKLLSNSLTGNFFLPQAKLIIAPNNIIQLKSAFLTSISYPFFNYTFYPQNIAGLHGNNILLEPIKLSSFNLQIDIKKNDFYFKSGFLASQQNNIPKINNFNVPINVAKSTSNMAYFGFEFLRNESKYRPSFVLHSINPSRDTINQSFFYPEFNLHVSHEFKKLGVNAILNSRWLGKYSSLQVSNIAILHELETQPIVNFAVAKQLFKNRVNLMAGINDLLDVNVLERATFALDEFNKTLIRNSSVYNGRGRYYFVRIKIDIR